MERRQSEHPEETTDDRADDGAELMSFQYRTMEPRGVVNVSDALARALGHSPQDFLEDPLLLVRLTIDADRKQFTQLLSSRNPNPPSLAVSWRTGTGGILHTWLTAQSIQNEDGELVALKITARSNGIAESGAGGGPTNALWLARALEQVKNHSTSVEERVDRLADSLAEVGVDNVLVLIDFGKQRQPDLYFRSKSEYPDLCAALDRVRDRWHESTRERLISDVTADPVVQELPSLVPFNSLAVVPISAGSVVIGTVVIGTSPRSKSPAAEGVKIATCLTQSLADGIEIEHLHSDVNDLSRSRDRFLSTVAHELKTPLTSIRGYAQLLGRYLMQESPDIVRSRRAVNGLGTQVDRFLVLAEDLLDAARINQNQLDLRLAEADLSEVLRAVSERVQSFATADNPRIVVNAPLEAWGRWDVSRIDQMLEILLSNALHYSAAGEVNLALEMDEDDVTVTISDDGIGIEEQDLDRIFEPFERGRVAARTTTGSGLGLYRAREIVRLHGGMLEIQSQPDVGTTVIVRLPIDASPGY